MFHKEGHLIIIISFITVSFINLISFMLLGNVLIAKIIGSVTIIILVLILQFFRNPKRKTQINDSLIISPVDGKVVAAKTL